MKILQLPTKTVIDGEQVAAILSEGPAIFECTYNETRAIDNWVRRNVNGNGVSHKVAARDIDGNVVAYRLELRRVVRQRKRRTS